LIKNEDINAYKNEIKKNPLRIDNYIMFGIYYSEHNKFDEAIYYFRKALSIPKAKALTFDLSSNKSPAPIKKAIEFNPHMFSYTNYLIARIYLYQGKIDNSIIEVKKAIADYPKESEYYYFLGHIYSKKGEYKKALLNYQKALEIRKNYDDALNGIGYIYLKQGENQKALELFEKNIELNPTYSNGYDSLAEYYFNEGDYGAACRYYGKACDFGKTNSCKKLEKALILEKNNKK
jgi:tetratricopeptide (TPR) repeat protein